MLLLAAFIVTSCARLAAQEWSPQLAAQYLDARQKEWFAWKTAKAPGGPCVSCHTGMTYLLARPALRRALKESGRTEYEIGLLNALRARVANKEAKDIYPAFAKEPIASQAVGSEAILATLLLTIGGSGWNAETEQAFGRMWSLQIRDGEAKGAWQWFSLNLDPWEMPESRFYGTALAALAVANAPAEYRKHPEVRERVTHLIGYLQNAQQSQPLHNRLMLLWASSRLRDVLTEKAWKSILDEVWSKQQADGGWTLDALGPWKEHPKAVASVGTNSYATAFTAFVLTQAGIKRSDARVRRSLDWLSSQQDPKKGYWTAESMNKQYEPGSMQAGFMRDAATAFAALALINE